MFIHVDRSPGGDEPRKLKVFAQGETALSRKLSPFQAQWLLQYVCEKWTNLHNDLSPWRAKLDTYEKKADDNYSDRRTAVDTERTDAARPIFERENNTLGIVSNTIDSVYAKAKDDIFGTRPWLAATPQGADDVQLAQQITRHSQWKIDQSNTEAALIDAIRLALDLGTVFVKPRWYTETETFVGPDIVAVNKVTGKPVMSADGDHVRSNEEIPADYPDSGNIEWKEMETEQTQTVYHNLDTACLDYKDVAFDPTATDLDLRLTPFFCRFKMGLHDLCAHYKLTPEQKQTLTDAVTLIDTDGQAREHRGEDISSTSSMDSDAESNPEIMLIEGFLRCDPFNSGSPIRMRVVFSPDLNAIFQLDYLANVTPGGILPIFPVRCFKTPRRIIGKGYWERFEKAEDCIDGLYNVTTVRNRESADVFTGFRPDLLKDEVEGQDVVNHPTKVFELNEQADDIAKVFSFVAKPDNNNRTDQLLQQMTQILQLRLGTVTAAQGELTGVPSNDTATGSKLIQGKGDLLTGCQIAQIMSDLEKPVEFAVALIYAHQDTDETFTWGEGNTLELVEIQADTVNALRMNVSLSLTQSKSLQMLESAKAAIEIAMQYAQIPEAEKEGLRGIFIQAIHALGFHDADKVIREAVVDVAGISALLPESVRPAFEEFAAQQGMAMPADGTEGTTEAAGPETPEA